MPSSGQAFPVRRARGSRGRWRSTSPMPRPAGCGCAVRAAGLNPYDSKLRSGAYPEMKLPRGTRQRVRRRDRRGRRGCRRDWPSATRCSAGHRRAWPSSSSRKRRASRRNRPASTGTVAGGIGLVGNTARRASASLSLTERDTVLVSGVAGGVGLLSAQFALRAGARVIGTASDGAPRVPAWARHPPGGLRRRPDRPGSAAAPGGITARPGQRGPGSDRAGARSSVCRRTRINSVAYDGAEDFGIGTVGGGDKTSAELAELADWPPAADSYCRSSQLPAG